jgi:hypothetical protein
VPTGQNVAAAADYHACSDKLAQVGDDDIFIDHGGDDLGDEAAD